MNINFRLSLILLALGTASCSMLWPEYEKLEWRLIGCCDVIVSA
jgi:hypothetical protein